MKITQAVSASPRNCLMCDKSAWRRELRLLTTANAGPDAKTVLNQPNRMTSVTQRLTKFKVLSLLRCCLMQQKMVLTGNSTTDV